MSKLPQKMLAPWKKSNDKPRQHIKKQRHYFANKDLPSQSYGFSSSHVWMWELDYKESWALKYWWFWTVVLEKTLESPLDCKEIQLVHPKGNQFWIFIGRTDTEAEAPIIWPPGEKNWLIRKDHDAGKDWRQKQKRVVEDELDFCPWGFADLMESAWSGLAFPLPGYLPNSGIESTSSRSPVFLVNFLPAEPSSKP